MNHIDKIMDKSFDLIEKKIQVISILSVVSILFIFFGFSREKKLCTTDPILIQRNGVICNT